MLGVWNKTCITFEKKKPRSRTDAVVKATVTDVTIMFLSLISTLTPTRTLTMTLTLKQPFEAVRTSQIGPSLKTWLTPSWVFMIFANSTSESQKFVLEIRRWQIRQDLQTTAVRLDRSRRYIEVIAIISMLLGNDHWLGRPFASLMFTWFPGIRLPVLTADTRIFLWLHAVAHFSSSDRNQVHVEQIKRCLSSPQQSCQ